MNVSTKRIGVFSVITLAYSFGIEHSVTFEWGDYIFTADDRNFENLADCFTAVRHVQQFFAGCRANYDDDLQLWSFPGSRVVAIRPEYLLFQQEV